VVSRAQYPQVRNRPEFDNPGVYALLGPPDEDGVKPRVYVGEADALRARLDQHARTKDFWTRLVAFSSTDGSINKAHVRYIEARLCLLAAKAKTWQLENGATPNTPQLTEADQADADAFLHDMLMLFPLLQVDAFEVVTPPPRPTAPQALSAGPASLELQLSGPSAMGRGRDEPEGFIVLAGALARLAEVESMHEGYSRLRQQLIDDELLVPRGDQLELTEDHRFTSPSQAAAVLLARPANGRTEWKTDDGRTLKEVQAAAIDASG
jgi:hypothetical protein